MWERRIQEFAAAMGHPLDAATASRLVAHWHLVQEENRRQNLTALEGEAALIRHIFDSLAVLRVYDGTGPAVDIGPGAGYPGLVLAGVFPETSWTLVESVGKRARFLSTAVETLGLAAVTVVHARAEVWARSVGPHARWVTARAVADLPTSLELALPLLTVGGRCVAMRGPEGAADVEAAGRAIGTLGGRVEAVVPYELPDGSRRTLVVVRKETATPTKFPRRGGALGRF
jgi:16S rRNA (guanine527-N7)-methyltransferase